MVVDDRLGFLPAADTQTVPLNFLVILGEPQYGKNYNQEELDTKEFCYVNNGYGCDVAFVCRKRRTRT